MVGQAVPNGQLNNSSGRSEHDKDFNYLLIINTNFTCSWFDQKVMRLVEGPESE